MDSQVAAANLQTIRILMERSALYRRALVPIMITTGSIGVAAGALGRALGFETAQGFVGFWLAVAVTCMMASFLIARRQAFKDREPFWSPAARRVAFALAPALGVGCLAGVFTFFSPEWDFVKPWHLPALWTLLYGCALHSASFFMPRPVRLCAWIFVLLGVGQMSEGLFAGVPTLLNAHLVMGGLFGLPHLALGVILAVRSKASDV